MVILESSAGSYVVSGGKRYSYFAGNNYLGLADHPSVKEAVIEAVSRYGINFAASRLTTGTSDLHLELESALARFKRCADAVVFASGYQGNGILTDVLSERYDTIFADADAHSSIVSAVPCHAAPVVWYNHCDAGDLERKIGERPRCRPLVMTDGIFALTGEIAPLDRIWTVIARYHGILIVDEAHATGVLGSAGRGTAEHFGLMETVGVYQTETMSKALGSYGGFIAGDNTLTELIRERSATYQASTALPPPVVAGSLAALRLLEGDSGRRDRLLANAATIRRAVIEMGFTTTDYPTPVIPLVMSSATEAEELSSFLVDNGIIVPKLNYPSREEKHMLRIAVSASHSKEQIDQLLELLNKRKKKI